MRAQLRTRADITGLTTAGITELELTQAEKVKYDDILGILAPLIDGKYAASMADIRMVASVGTNTLWLSTIANTNRNETVAQVLRSNGVTWHDSRRHRHATLAGDFGAFIGLQRGIMNAGVAPVWSSAQLITDIYSGAKSGEVPTFAQLPVGLGIPARGKLQAAQVHLRQFYAPRGASADLARRLLI